MPHEVDMTRALIMSLKRWRSECNDNDYIQTIHLVVGEFTCVEPDLLRTAFARQRQGGFLEDAELVIRESPFIAYCLHCRKEYRPDIDREYACPECRSPLNEIRSGRELKIESVETAPREQRQWNRPAQSN